MNINIEEEIFTIVMIEEDKLYPLFIKGLRV
jgi:hypothetical protein